MLLCTIGPPMLTKSVLKDKDKAAKISDEGHKCVEDFRKDPRLERLFSIGREFSVRTGLAGDRMIEAIDACAPYGKAGMSMLGNSVFCTGNLDILGTILRQYGGTYRCDVDALGSRLL